MLNLKLIFFAMSPRRASSLLWEPLNKMNKAPGFNVSDETQSIMGNSPTVPRRTAFKLQNISLRFFRRKQDFFLFITETFRTGPKG